MRQTPTEYLFDSPDESWRSCLREACLSLPKRSLVALGRRYRNPAKFVDIDRLELDILCWAKAEYDSWLRDVEAGEVEYDCKAVVVTGHARSSIFFGLVLIGSQGFGRIFFGDRTYRWGERFLLPEEGARVQPILGPT